MSSPKVHPANWTNEAVRDFWDYYASNIQDDKYFSHRYGKHLLKHFAGFLPQSGRILDFGCGPGFLIDHFLKTKCQATIEGVDFSLASVTKTQAAYAHDPRFGGAKHLQALPAPLETASMDLIFSVEVIEHLNPEYLSATIKEIFRLLKPGGIWIVTVPNAENLEANSTCCPECGCIFHIWQHLQSFNKHSLEVLARDHGFRPLIVQEYYFRSWQGRLLETIVKATAAIARLKTSFALPHLYAVAQKPDER